MCGLGGVQKEKKAKENAKTSGTGDESGSRRSRGKSGEIERMRDSYLPA